ncbi:hypothetical protein [Streptomyces zaomyceticus]
MTTTAQALDGARDRTARDSFDSDQYFSRPPRFDGGGAKRRRMR